MNTMELDAARAEIIRSLFEVDNLEALNKVKHTVARVIKSVMAEVKWSKRANKSRISVLTDRSLIYGILAVSRINCRVGYVANND